MSVRVVTDKYAKLIFNTLVVVVSSILLNSRAMSGNERYMKQLVICHNLSYLELHFENAFRV